MADLRINRGTLPTVKSLSRCLLQRESLPLGSFLSHIPLASRHPALSQEVLRAHFAPLLLLRPKFWLLFLLSYRRDNRVACQVVPLSWAKKCYGHTSPHSSARPGTPQVRLTNLHPRRDRAPRRPDPPPIPSRNPERHSGARTAALTPSWACATGLPYREREPSRKEGLLPVSIACPLQSARALQGVLYYNNAPFV